MRISQPFRPRSSCSRCNCRTFGLSCLLPRSSKPAFRGSTLSLFVMVTFSLSLMITSFFYVARCGEIE
ncbi:hypothetical protein Hanom_Chr00s004382g01721691 [Helianthus anomalus]